MFKHYLTAKYSIKSLSHTQTEQTLDTRETPTKLLKIKYLKHQTIKQVREKKKKTNLLVEYVYFLLTYSDYFM